MPTPQELKCWHNLSYLCNSGWPTGLAHNRGGKSQTWAPRKPVSRDNFSTFRTRKHCATLYVKNRSGSRVCSRVGFTLTCCLRIASNDEGRQKKPRVFRQQSKTLVNRELIMPRLKSWSFCQIEWKTMSQAFRNTDKGKPSKDLCTLNVHVTTNSFCNIEWTIHYIKYDKLWLQLIKTC